MIERPEPETASKTVTVFGGTGFLGTRIVDRLLDLGFSVRVASRHPQRPQRQGASAVGADVNDEGSVATAVDGAFGVVNAVSLYVEGHGQSFQSVHVAAAARVARQAKAAGVERLCHVSGLGADAASASPYIASRGQGETAVREAFPDACLVRPSVMFGPGDALVVPISQLLRRLPVFALFGRGKTRLQPVHVDDVAQAVAKVIATETPASLYEFGGPSVYSYRELVEMLRGEVSPRTLLVPLPFTLWHGLAAMAERLPGPPITRNQVALMRLDNVISGRCAGFGDLAIKPRRLDTALPEILAAS